MFLSENFHFDKSITFDRSNANELSPNPYYKQKEQTRKKKNLVCLLFFLFVKFLLSQK